MIEITSPDPGRGVFTTVLVSDGEVVERAAHLHRLQTSTRALYGCDVPRGLDEAIDAAGERLALGRLRIELVPDGERLEPQLVGREIAAELVLPGAAGALALRMVEVSGWSGAHKWSDRRMLEQLDERVAPEGALLVDPARGVLETTRANVFAVRGDGTVVTPPADGGVLPGVARARVLALAHEQGLAVAEEPLATGVLTGASEAFTTGSVRGIEPIASVDGGALPAVQGPVTRALVRRLGESWFGPRGRPVPGTIVT